MAQEAPHPVVGFADLHEAASAAGWSQELWDDVCSLRPDRGAVEQWLDTGWPPPEGIADWVATELRFVEGTLNRRLATWADNDLVSEIYAGSPETVGDWEVTVEHGPYAFGQLRLQDNGVTTIIEDQRVGQAAISRATRNVMVGDDEITVMAICGMRVHRDHQGKGLSNAVLFCPGLSTLPFAAVGYWYARPDNSSAPWLAAVVENMEDQADGMGSEAMTLTATVFYAEVGPEVAVPVPPADGVVRSVRRDELAECGRLVDRVNDGLDLASPATPEYLRRRLNSWGLGAIPSFFDPVYTEDDYLVVERDGRIVACGGLWDRGRNMRERWRHPESGEERVVECGALLDYGYEDGAVQDMAALIDAMAARCLEQGRSSLMLPIEHDQELRRAVGHRQLRPETRNLQVMPFAMPGLDPYVPELVRPATDLAYW